MTKVSNGMRAYVAGEGYYAKAQKSAAIDLLAYLETSNSSYYAAFQQNLSVNLGDRKAREELLKQTTDYDLVVEGFTEGKNHPEDIGDLIFIFDYFGWLPQVKEAIDIWTRADNKLLEFIALGEEIKEKIESGDLNQEDLRIFPLLVTDLDAELTGYEEEFSSHMNEVARYVNNVVKWSIISLALIILIMAGSFSYWTIESVKKWSSRLEKSEALLSTIVHNSSEILYNFNATQNKIEYVSPAVYDLLGYTAEEWVENGIKFVTSLFHPEDLPRLNTMIDEAREKQEIKSYTSSIDFRMQHKDGNYIWMHLNRRVVKNKNSGELQVIGILSNIEVQKQLFKELQKSHDQKEVLLQEIHHRVKNNLTLVSNILELQKRTDRTDIENILSECQSRIISIAKIHEKLYKSMDMENIQMDAYTRDLVEVINDTFSFENCEIDVKYEMDSFSIPLEKAIKCGLIISELVTNAYKHGFKGKEKGILIVKVTHLRNSISISIMNNQNPLPDNYAELSKSSFGVSLVDVMVEELEGELKIESGEFTEFTFSFTEDELVEESENNPVKV
ncbi:MAG: PAS domain-containing protein [Balneolaceae bacterium]|nr:PAS domain-containing protein [Balneolaceae bacterium]